MSPQIIDMRVAKAVELVREGVPIQDAALIHDVTEDELDDALVAFARAHAHFVSELVSVVVKAARMGDAKAAAWLLERRSPAFRKAEGKLDVATRTVVEMPANGRLRQ